MVLSCWASNVRRRMKMIYSSRSVTRSTNAWLLEHQTRNKIQQGSITLSFTPTTVDVATKLNVTDRITLVHETRTERRQLVTPTRCRTHRYRRKHLKASIWKHRIWKHSFTWFSQLSLFIFNYYSIIQNIQNYYTKYTNKFQIYIIILSFWSHCPHGPVMLGFKREKKDEDDILFEVSDKIDKRLTAGTPNKKKKSAGQHHSELHT